jgi:homocitrate synthase
VDQLNLHLTDDQCKEVTAKIKKLGDVRSLNIDDVDSIIRDYHAEVTTPMVSAQDGVAVPPLKKQKTQNGDAAESA